VPRQPCGGLHRGLSDWPPAWLAGAAADPTPKPLQARFPEEVAAGKDLDRIAADVCRHYVVRVDRA
jgi:hypothetical protein